MAKGCVAVAKDRLSDDPNIFHLRGSSLCLKQFNYSLNKAGVKRSMHWIKSLW